MNIQLSYAFNDARDFSPKGNPIPLYALARQGIAFDRGNFARVTNEMMRFFTGVTISSIDSNAVGLIVPVFNIIAPTFTLATGAIIFTPSNDHQVHLDMISHTNVTIVEYGQHLANLYFLPLAS